MAPVLQVTQLLEELQVKVVTEGKQEATTYDAFACFCKDTSKKKSDAIAENDATVISLEGKLETQEENRDTADSKIDAKTKGSATSACFGASGEFGLCLPPVTLSRAAIRLDIP